MTTASETRSIIASLSPVIDVRRNDPQLTAELFVENNIRHIVNRRMRWTDVQGFVQLSLRALIHATAGTINMTSINVAFQTIKDAVNRRRTWFNVQPWIVEDVKHMILASERGIL